MTALDNLAMIALHPRFAYRYGEDCVQDAYLKAMSMLDQFNTARGNLEQWFSRIVRNLWRDNYRRDNAGYKLRCRAVSIERVSEPCSAPIDYGRDEGAELNWPEIISRTELSDKRKERLRAIVERALAADDIPAESLASTLARAVRLPYVEVRRLLNSLRNCVSLAG
jgi:DNA-directed RNA polymerase specialized sigma24 family protein